MVSLMWVVGHREMAYDHPPDDNMSNTSTLTIPDHEGWSPWVSSPNLVDLKPKYADFAYFNGNLSVEACCVALWVGLYMALTTPIGHPLTFLEDLGFITAPSRCLDVR